MHLKAPSFWYNDPSLKGRCKAALLLPFSLLYLIGHKLHQLAIRPYRASIPVICVGNLVAGGSGKTPTALALMQLVRDHHWAENPCFLSRGYGGSEKGPAFAQRHKHRHHETGDEPLLLARHAPAIVSANRKHGAQWAEHHHHDLIIMDDGLQNPQLHKDIKIVVIDSGSGFGNKFPIPAGPLREPLRCGLKQADAFILIGEDRYNVSSLLPPEKPVFRARLDVPESWLADRKSSYVAFCGLGRPEKFRKTILKKGLNLVHWETYPDHHDYTRADLEYLDNLAAEKNAHLLTTEKDAQRLPADFHWRSGPPHIMPVEMIWDDGGAAISKFFAKNLSASPLSS